MKTNIDLIQHISEFQLKPECYMVDIYQFPNLFSENDI